MQKTIETMNKNTLKNNNLSNNGNNNSNEHKSLIVPKTPMNNNELFTSPEYTLILPDINIQPADFREFLKRDLLETTTLVSLELAGRLNWWVDLGVCRRLFPLVTTGDGNCLLHAASLALFGRHDNKLILRSALNRMMSNATYKDAFFRRWRWNQTILNKQSELVFTEEEWKEEWRNLTKMASAQPRMSSNNNSSIENNEDNERKNKSYYNGFGDDYDVNYMEGNSANGTGDFTKNNGNNYNTVQFNLNRPSTKPPVYNYNTIPNNNNNLSSYNYSSTEEYEMDEMLYESLEEFHVFVLAHVLCRPIIIVADTILKNLNGEPLAPISFGGIYLPLEISPSECCKSPLLLTYDAAHFSALVPMEDSSKSVKLADAIPLVDPDFELLPVHFAYDPGDDFQWGNEDISPNIENLPHLSDDKLHLLKILKSYMDIRFLGVPYSGDLEEERSPNNPRNSLHDSGIASNSPCSSNINASRDGSHGENSIATCSVTASKQSKKENDGGSALKQQKPSQASSCSSKNNKKFLSFRKRLGKTFKFGLCASGIKREVEDDKEENDKSADVEGDSKQKTSEKSSAITNTKPDDSDNREEYLISKMQQKNKKDSTHDWTTNDSIESHVLKDTSDTPTQNVNKTENKETTPVTMQPDVSDNELPSDDLTQLKCADSILCTKLFHKRDKAQDLILKKYIQVAKERFRLEGCRKENQCCSYVNCREHQHTQQIGIQHQQQQCNIINTSQTSTTASMALKGNQNNGSLKGVKGKFENMSCINVGCEGKGGNPDTSYLCEECFVRQKQEEIDLTVKFTDKKHQQQQLYNSHSFPQKQLQNQLKFNNTYSNQFPKSTSVFINNQPSTHNDNHWSNNNMNTNNNNKRAPSAEPLKQTTDKHSHPVTITSVSASYSSSTPFNSKTFLDTTKVPKIDSTFENVRKNTGYTITNNSKYNTRSNVYNYKNNFYNNDKSEQMKSSNPGINKLGKVYEVKRETSLSSTPTVTSHFFTQLQDRKVLQNNNMANNINIKNNMIKNYAVATSDYNNLKKDFDFSKRVSKGADFEEFLDDPEARHSEELRSLLPADSAQSSNSKFYNYKSSYGPDASNDKDKFTKNIADHHISTKSNATFRTEKLLSDRMYDNVRDFDCENDDDDDDYTEKWKERERNIIMRALNNNDNAIIKDATQSDRFYSKNSSNKNMMISNRANATKTLDGVKLSQPSFKDNMESGSSAFKTSTVYNLSNKDDRNYKYHQDGIYNNYDKDEYEEGEDSNSVVNMEKASFNVGNYNDKHTMIHCKGNTNIHSLNKTGNISRTNDTMSSNRTCYEVVNELPQQMAAKQKNSKNFINTNSVHKDYPVHNSQEENKDPWAKLQRF